MGNKQYKNDETLKMIKRIRTDILIKEDETSRKKRENRLRHNSKRIRVKIIISDTHKIERTIIHKRLSRRSTLQEMNTIKQVFLRSLFILNIQKERIKTSNRL